MNRSIYSHHIVTDADGHRVIIIYDQNGPSCKTVTNDADLVLQDVRDAVAKTNFDEATAVIYRDSESIFDGLMMSARDQTALFYSIGETDENRAVVRAIQLARGTHEKRPTQEPM